MAQRQVLGFVGQILHRCESHKNYPEGVLLGARDEAIRQGAELIVVARGATSYGGGPIADDLADGWIVNMPNVDLAQAPTGKPIVAVGSLIGTASIPSVLPDNAGAMKAAVQHLVEHGRRSIGYVGFPGHIDLEQRMAAFQAALALNGLEVDRRLVQNAASHDPDAAAETCREMLATGAPLSAIVCGTDRLAFGVIQELKARGRRVPEDVAIIGVDDASHAEHAEPPLTTVRQHFSGLGRRAVEVLTEMLRGASAAAISAVPTRLVRRRSCGCAPGEVLVGTGRISVDALPEWRRGVARRLVEVAELDHDPRTFAPARAWAQTLARDLELVLMDSSVHPHEGTTAACRTAVALIDDAESLEAVVRFLDQAGSQWIAANPESFDAGQRLRLFVRAMRVELLRACNGKDRDERIAFARLFREIVTLGVQQSETAAVDLSRFEWLRHTRARWAVLGWWDGGPEGDTLVVGGQYCGACEAPLCTGRRYARQEFPPREILGAARAAAPTSATFVFPVTVGGSEIGVFAVGLPQDELSLSFGAWAPIVNGALVRLERVRSR